MEAQAQWEVNYAEEPVLRKGGVSAGGRWRRLHLLTGLVLPVWEATSSALADLQRSADRRLKVLRLQTTGDQALLTSPCPRWEFSPRSVIADRRACFASQPLVLVANRSFDHTRYTVPTCNAENLLFLLRSAIETQPGGNLQRAVGFTARQ